MLQNIVPPPSETYSSTNGGLAVLLGDDQVARMVHGGASPRSRQTTDGWAPPDYASAADVYIRAVFHESGVQRAEGIAPDVKIAAEVRFNQLPGLLVISAARLPTFTPSGSLPSNDSSRTKYPFTKTS